jgi:rhodanese-related sulfurtransferase
MKKIWLLLLSLPVLIQSHGQFKNDNVLYKTIDPFDLCKALEQSPGYVLLDVRSNPEYEDTTSFNMDYGRFKNAININVRELGKRIHELDAYRDNPIFVYCSHSQRSRVASKMLSDSGFTNVNNVNGGITSFHYLSVLNEPCVKNIYETKNNFSFISPATLCQKINSNAAAIFLLDVRSDSAFKHISRDDKENALGYIRGSVNIPLENIQKALYDIPAGKQIIITDIYGHEAEAAAKLLLQKGYQNISVLTEGIDRWMAMNAAVVPCKNTLHQNAVPYNLLANFNFAQWIKDNKTYRLLDIRTAEEFANNHKDKYRNIGHLKNSINIPLTELERRLNELGNDKNTAIVVYGFGGGPEAFTAASTLVKKGFNNVNVLYDGIFNVRWTAGNVKGWSSLSSLVENVPDENR